MTANFESIPILHGFIETLRFAFHELGSETRLRLRDSSLAWPQLNDRAPKERWLIAVMWTTRPERATRSICKTRLNICEPASALAFLSTVRLSRLSFKCLMLYKNNRDSPPFQVRLSSVKPEGRLLAAASMINHLVYSNSKQGSPSFNHAYDRAWLPLGMAIQAEARLIILSICDWTSVQIPPYVDSSSDTNGNQHIIRICETVQYFPWQAGPFKPSLRRATWCAPCNKARLRAKTACFDSQFATSEPQGTNTTSYSMCLTNGFHTIWSKVLRPPRLNLEKRKIKTRDSSGKECAHGLPRPQCPKQRLNNMTGFSTKATSYGDFRL